MVTLGFICVEIRPSADHSSTPISKLAMSFVLFLTMIHTWIWILKITVKFGDTDLETSLCFNTITVTFMLQKAVRKWNNSFLTGSLFATHFTSINDVFLCIKLYLKKIIMMSCWLINKKWLSLMLDSFMQHLGTNLHCIIVSNTLHRKGFRLRYRIPHRVKKHELAKIISAPSPGEPTVKPALTSLSEWNN